MAVICPRDACCEGFLVLFCRLMAGKWSFRYYLIKCNNGQELFPAHCSYFISSPRYAWPIAEKLVDSKELLYKYVVTWKWARIFPRPFVVCLSACFFSDPRCVGRWKFYWGFGDLLNQNFFASWLAFSSATRGAQLTSALPATIR